MNRDDRDRLERERRTIAAMIEIYCRGQGHTPSTTTSHIGNLKVRANGSDLDASALCNECNELLEYAMRRVEKCPFKAEKPTCAKCQIHCYLPARRQKVRQVMRYAGPRMLVYHPILTVLHYWDEVTRKPAHK